MGVRYHEVEEGKYDLVHCHTPIAAAVTRVACRPLRKKGVKVLYTAHGFHFYDGAPLKNWLLYYPVEWLCAFWTDGLITINSEDYRRAKKRLHAKRVYYVPGVGTNIDGFGVDCKHEIRKEFNIPESAILFLSVGELNKNKNHQVVIKALAEVNNTNIYYIIAGAGDEVPLKDLIQKYRLENRVFLAGYRTNIKDFLADADVYILPSIREGLNVSIMEAMASGKPCLVSDIRGNRDLIDDHGGIRFDPHSVVDTRKAIVQMLDKREMWRQYGGRNRRKVEKYESKRVNTLLERIYNEVK
nr:glycosyltransferase [[Eubacterium] cellulosolvens]